MYILHMEREAEKEMEMQKQAEIREETKRKEMQEKEFKEEQEKPKIDVPPDLDKRKLKKLMFWNESDEDELDDAFEKSLPDIQMNKYVPVYA